MRADLAAAAPNATRSRARAWCVAVALVTLPLPRAAQAPEGAWYEAQRLFADWMQAASPSADALAQAARGLERGRDVLQAALVHALEHGPRRSAPRAGATDAPLRGFADALARRQRAQRETLDYRARALLGLALIGDAQVQAQIAQRAADGADPLAPAARAALRIVQAN